MGGINHFNTKLVQPIFFYSFIQPFEQKSDLKSSKGNVDQTDSFGFSPEEPFEEGRIVNVEVRGRFYAQK